MGELEVLPKEKQEGTWGSYVICLLFSYVEVVGGMRMEACLRKV